MHKELNQTSRNTGFDNSLNLVVGTIGEVGNGPACIDKDFIIQGVNELS